ncbi:MAG: hypothetical protein ACRDWS_10225 [Acidimicrobiia bacterium]
MSDVAKRRWAWMVWAVMVLAYLGEVILLFLTADLNTTDPGDLASPLVQALEDLAFVAVGMLGLRVVLRQPTNAVGWWIMAAGISFPVEGLAAEFRQFGENRWGAVPVVLAAGWVARWIWILASFNIPFLLLLYPDGHLPSRRWRPVLWLAVSVVVVAFVAMAVYTEPDAVAGDLPNPLGVPALAPMIESLNGFVLFPSQYLLIVLGLLSLVARFRRGEGVERQQIKVLMWVGPVALAFFAVSATLDRGPVWLGPALNFGFTVFLASAITLAILRYRLFEIDRLISRTVSYAIVAGALAAVYVFGAVWLPTRVVGEQTPLFVAGSTLAVAALFNPVRRRVMRWVERRFNRSRYDPEQIAEEFAASLRDQVDTDRLAEDWVTVVTGTLQPSAVGVWVREKSGR